MICFCSVQKSVAQCSIVFTPSLGFNCLTSQPVLHYTVTGAVAPYSCTFAASPGNNVIATANTATGTGTVNAFPAGFYNVYISAANNCTLSYTNVQVSQSPSSSNTSFINTLSVTCNGGNDGATTVVPPTSFSANPTFAWSPGGFNTAQVTTLQGGIIYTVTISDAKGCVKASTITVNEPPPIASALTNTFINCFGNTLNTSITSTGNIGATSYSVNGNPVNSNNASNLLPGIQTITTKDSKGCVKTNTVLVTQRSQALISFIVVKPTCPGVADGSASAAMSVAGGPFSYTWQPGGINTALINNIPTGTYSVSIRDGNNCITTSVTPVLPAASATVSALTKSENCSAADGAFTLNVSGVNPPFTFTTITIGPHPTNIVTNLSSGSYTSITNYNNTCLDTIIFNVGNLSTVTLGVQNLLPVLCYNNCTGSLSATVQNAVGAVSYSLNGTPSTTGNLFSGICAGVQTIKAIDANGCPATLTVNFTAPPVFSYTASAPGTACSGQQISLLGTASGGSGGYTYLWNPGAIQGQVVNLTPSGTSVYSLNAYDSNGCTQAPVQVTVIVLPPITISINNQNTGICPGSTAQITPTVSGGDGNYSYLWLPGNTNGPSVFVQNISVPNYTLAVNDGCGSATARKVVSINLFPVIKPTFVSQGKKGCEPFCTRFINSSPRSSLAVWHYGDQPEVKNGDTTFYCYRNSGVYDLTLQITDSNACKTSYTYSNAIEVIESPKAEFESELKKITIKNSENVLIRNLSEGGITYQWAINGKSYSDSENIYYTFNDTGCYKFRLIARNINNCLDTTQKYLCVTEDFNFYMPDCFTPNENNLNDFLLPQGTGWLNDHYLFEVFNRWGRRIFTTEDIRTGWDGTNADEVTPFGNYIWRVKIRDTRNDEHEFRGHVTLLR